MSLSREELNRLEEVSRQVKELKKAISENYEMQKKGSPEKSSVLKQEARALNDRYVLIRNQYFQSLKKHDRERHYAYMKGHSFFQHRFPYTDTFHRAPSAPAGSQKISIPSGPEARGYVYHDENGNQHINESKIFKPVSDYVPNTAAKTISALKIEDSAAENKIYTYSAEADDLYIQSIECQLSDPQKAILLCEKAYMLEEAYQKQENLTELAFAKDRLEHFREGIANCYQNMGVEHFDHEELGEALQKFTMAYEIRTYPPMHNEVFQSNHRRCEEQIFSILSAYFKGRSPDQALQKIGTDYVSLAPIPTLTETERNENDDARQRNIAFVLKEVGDIYFKQSNFDRALQYYDRAISMQAYFPEEALDEIDIVMEKANKQRRVG